MLTSRSSSSQYAPTVMAAIGAAGALVLLSAAALTMGPLWLVAAAAALFGAAFSVRFSSELPKVFLGALALLLCGYALFGRSFAVIGVPPVYVGELVLAVGLIAGLLSGRLSAVARVPVSWLLFAVMLWGALRTIPFIGEYGVMALRDAVLWGYGVFAVIVAACLLRTNTMDAALRMYGRAIPWFVPWVSIIFLLGLVFPIVHGTADSLIEVKLSDCGVHLGGAAAFVLLFGRGELESVPAPGWLRSGRRVFWVLWLIGVTAVLSKTRGGFVALVTALAVVAVLDPLVIGRRMVKAVIGITVVTVTIMGAVLMLDSQSVTEAEDRDRSRSFTFSQMTANVLSLADISGTADTAQSDTRRWRTEWWDTITAYTIGGQFFWGGKGFGINLADDDGFQTIGVDEGVPVLRSPHNAHLTMLARSGVPGLGLWLLLHLAFAASLTRAFFRARRLGWHDWARVNLWVLAYWTAFIVNASFDVAFEGPYAGIWFWCIVGAGLAALRSQQVSERAWRLGIAPR